MNKKGTRNTNGEGCIYTTIAKQKRKKFLSEECSICKNALIDLFAIIELDMINVKNVKNVKQNV